MTPLILAIDPATQTGYAVGGLARRATVLESGTHALGTSDDGERYADLYALCELLRGRSGAEGIGVVAWEAGFHRGGAATRYHHGYVAVLQMWAHRFGVRTFHASVSQVKATSGGGGRAGKDAMTWRAREYFGIEPKDDNESDALWLYECARAQLWAASITGEPWHAGSTPGKRKPRTRIAARSRARSRLF